MKTRSTNKSSSAKKTMSIKALAIPLIAAPLLMAQQASAQEPAFELYGFAQLDYIQDFERVNPEWESTLRPSRIPTQDGQFGSDGQAIFSIKQSRLGVNAAFPVGGDTVTTKFEFDLYGVGDDVGQTTMRIRHVYGEWKNILAGQTNSLFMDGDVFPNTIDYWGPAGMVFLRNPQIRYTPMRGDMNLAFAIEKPGNDVDPGQFAGTTNIQGNQPFPDITGQFRLNRDWGHLQVAGILREVAYETPGTPDNEPSGDDLGYGIDVTSNIKFGSDKLILAAVYGAGIASYMNDGGMDMGPDNLSSDPGKAVPLLGVVAYYDHYWNEKWSTSFGYSFTEVDNQQYQTTDAFNKGEYASVNLVHTPAKRLMAGVELLWGKRTDNNGDTGTDTRVQFTMKYSFSSTDI